MSLACTRQSDHDGHWIGNEEEGSVHGHIYRTIQEFASTDRGKQKVSRIGRSAEIWTLDFWVPAGVASLSIPTFWRRCRGILIHTLTLKVEQIIAGCFFRVVPIQELFSTFKVDEGVDYFNVTVDCRGIRKSEGLRFNVRDNDAVQLYIGFNYFTCGCFFILFSLSLRIFTSPTKRCDFMAVLILTAPEFKFQLTCHWFVLKANSRQHFQISCYNFKNIRILRFEQCAFKIGLRPQTRFCDQLGFGICMC
jgi:hypothetical protein